jgi:hypothetical protein
MDGEKSGGKSGRPDTICRFIKKEEQKNNSAYMKKQIDKVMAGGVCSKKAPVQHMGNHSQWMPVSVNYRRERPFDTFGIKS